MSAAAASEGLFDCRDAWAAALDELAGADPRIVAVCNDSVGSSKLGGFRKSYPNRLINVGIAEQNMVGVGAGLANGGKIPFVSGAACFLTGRALEQIKADCAYSAANVKLCGMAPGVAYGELGATHHSIEDVAWLRTMHNMVILVPSDPWETAEAIKAAAAYEGPVFVRVSRMPVPAINRPQRRFEIGRAEVLRDGADMAFVVNGTLVHRALEAAELLAGEGISAKVINMASVNPLDLSAIEEAASTGAIVTAEEHVVRGGLGGAVAEQVAMTRPVPMRILGFPGFVPTGSAEWLLDHFGLNAVGLADAGREVIARKAATA